MPSFKRSGHTTSLFRGAVRHDVVLTEVFLDHVEVFLPPRDVANDVQVGTGVPQAA